MQGEYLQQREYGNVPSFQRTYRTGSISLAATDMPRLVLPTSYTHQRDAADGQTQGLDEDGLIASDGSTIAVSSATMASNNSSSNNNNNSNNNSSASVYRILPCDLSDARVLPQLKHRLDGLHPSQRDYVFAQLLDEVSITIILLRCNRPVLD